MQQSTTAFTTERRHLLEIIDGLIEGIILLDTDRHIAWANDTALAMYGAANLLELGGTAAGFRKHYALRHRNGKPLLASRYPMDRALAGEAFSDVVVEVTRKGQADAPMRVHRLRSLPLLDSDGVTEGMVLVCLDETDRYSAEERFERAFAANPAPALICRLDDMRCIKVNEGFMEMTGYSRDSLLGRKAREIGVLGAGPGRERALARLGEGRTIPQTETLLTIKGGGNKLVVVAGQPIDVGGHECMLFTYNDLESRRRAEIALRQSEERFSRAFRLAPVPMALDTLEGQYLEVNDAFVKVTGYAAEDIVGRADAAGTLWVDPSAYREAARALRATGSISGLEAVLRASDGSTLDCLVSAEVVTIDDIACVLTVYQDISERKRSEADLYAAIQTVMQDTSWFSRTVIEKLAQLRMPHTEARQAGGELADLSTREREVLGLMCQGLTDTEIALELHLSRNTIRNHVASLYSKIGVNRRSAAIVWARQRGIVGREVPAVASRQAGRFKPAAPPAPVKARSKTREKVKPAAVPGKPPGKGKAVRRKT
ncbi:PAS domain S-box protein [Orrella dioscoreae]|uniref:Sensory box transcriptional regulator, LuxR family n=1 Tax=Orrella dioscoreae TaxID=1851544 RepID=A0A1C3K1M5_9BURK|nr:PAS domain S-box protein [Orrella dioscoreae]SBT25406.1 Sensory box transcriptional regulator, LuxR family [Orrella dioscoreae]SOE48900.1 Sensory box transcriptional regulator, LuxR family [Orrella dioscoreae]